MFKFFSFFDVYLQLFESEGNLFILKVWLIASSQIFLLLGAFFSVFLAYAKMLGCRNRESSILKTWTLMLIHLRTLTLVTVLLGQLVRSLVL